MARIIRFLAALVIVFAPPAVGFTQEKSVKAGVHDPFRNPNVAEWVTKFEGGKSRDLSKSVKRLSLPAS